MNKHSTFPVIISEEKLFDLLSARNFPLHELSTYPISAFEGMTTELYGCYKSVCPIGCLGCCADSVQPSKNHNKYNILTPSLFNEVLFFLEKFIAKGLHILSLERLTLSSGSNELNHPYCLELRELLSSFLQKHYGFPLGFISSDIAFHVSDAEIFLSNLKNIIKKPYLWDNICISIDEQIPMHNIYDYQRYLDNLSHVWEILIPIIKGELSHPNETRRSKPRLIINFLIPDCYSVYDDAYKSIYPGGPTRATSYEELITRYVIPFLGTIQKTTYPIPPAHLFTTAISRFTRIPGSYVYISASKFKVTGRANSFINTTENELPNYTSSQIIRTKIYPTGANQFMIHGCFAPTLSSEDTITVSPENIPVWLERLHQFSFMSSKVDPTRKTKNG
jgi:hypothetical protein